MELSPECFDAVLQVSPVLRWLNDPSHTGLIVVGALAELIIHATLLFYVMTWLFFLIAWFAQRLVRIPTWYRYWRLPLVGKVMTHWYGSAWWTGKGTILVYGGREVTRQLSWLSRLRKLFRLVIVIGCLLSSTGCAVIGAGLLGAAAGGGALWTYQQGEEERAKDEAILRGATPEPLVHARPE